MYWIKSGIENPLKSEVIGRCGGDEKTEWPRRTDKSRTLKKIKSSDKPIITSQNYLIYYNMQSASLIPPSWPQINLFWGRFCYLPYMRFIKLFITSCCSIDLQTRRHIIYIWLKIINDHFKTSSTIKKLLKSLVWNIHRYSNIRA